MAPKRKRRSGGLGRVATAAARQKGKAQWLKLEDGDVITARVLDTGENFADAYVHRVPMEREDGSEYYADVPCLDQDDKGIPCPGCKDDLDRRYKYWANVIVRDWEDEAGKTADTIMIWSSGITLAKKLDKMEARHGLINRDIEIEREGSTMKNTKYDVDWADEENNELSDEDKKLAEKKHDLSRYTTPPSFDDFYVPVGERDKDDDDAGEKSVKRGSAFKRRTKKDEDEDEDGGRKRTATRRKPSSSSKSSSSTKLKGFNKGASEGSAKKTTVRRRRSR